MAGFEHRMQICTQSSPVLPVSPLVSHSSPFARSLCTFNRKIRRTEMAKVLSYKSWFKKKNKTNLQKYLLTEEPYSKL